MTLSSLLKVTNSVRINITLPKEEEYFTYKVDYLREGYEVENYGCFEYHKTTASLPAPLEKCISNDILLKRKVKRVDTNSTTFALEITVK